MPNNSVFSRLEFYSFCENFSKNLEIFSKNIDISVFNNLKKGFWRATNNEDEFLSTIKSKKFIGGGVSDFITDTFFYKLFDKTLSKSDTICSCLYDALYSLTASKNITIFLMQEMIDYQVDFTPYYKIWQSSGDIWYSANGWYVLEGNIIN
ncbi:hypothetical protein [Bartonella sp. HY406]|uniref:hypothetical protein n=1 Tax=Bartonella sp. HY406 TaxID=2979331 RepID=UPI0021C84250|nr:hypothetical protein [Bartonella sp. HY406]UXN05071.1 hypothetical protein N6B01_14730 [Bartonella sp. HY406]